MAWNRVARVEYLQRKLAQLPVSARAAAGHQVAANANNLAARMKRTVRKKSGVLAASINVGQGSFELSRRIWAGGPSTTKALRKKAKSGAGFDNKYDYAFAIEFGTRPHIAGGRFQGSRHPGNRPFPFFFVTYRAIKKDLVRKMGEAFRKAARATAQ